MPATATKEPKDLAAVAPTSLVNADAIQAAVALGKDGLEVLKGLHAIAKEERAATAQAACVAALAAFRADMPAITKTVPGQHGATRAGTRTKGLYAPLDSITPILDPIIARHGLTYRFDRETKEGKDFVLCIVSHRDGHEFSSRFPASSDTGAGRNAIQAIASGESYAKRYALIAAFGITTADPDDDGEASGAKDSEPITREQDATICSLLEDLEPDDAKREDERRRFLKWIGSTSIAAIPSHKFKPAVDGLQKKIAAKVATS